MHYTPLDWTKSNVNHYTRYKIIFLSRYIQNILIIILQLHHIGLHKYFFQFRDNTIRYKSERLRDEAEKLIKSRENKTVLTQHESNQKLNNRLHDVVLFRSELEVLFYSYFQL